MFFINSVKKIFFFFRTVKLIKSEFMFAMINLFINNEFYLNFKKHNSY